MPNNVKVGESGRTFYMLVHFDISGSSRLRLTWEKPDGTLMVRDSSAHGVETSSVNVFVTALSATATANEYAKYVLGTGSAGEIDQAGDWGVRLDYWVSSDTPVTHLVSDREDSAGNLIAMAVDAVYTSASVSAAIG